MDHGVSAAVAANLGSFLIWCGVYSIFHSTFIFIFYIMWTDVNTGNCVSKLISISTYSKSATGEVRSLGLGLRAHQSIELFMCPFRHTKALKKPNYTQANHSKTPRVKCLTSGITPFWRRDALDCRGSGSNQSNATNPVICRSLPHICAPAHREIRRKCLKSRSASIKRTQMNHLASAGVMKRQNTTRTRDGLKHRREPANVPTFCTWFKSGWWRM